MNDNDMTHTVAEGDAAGNAPAVMGRAVRAARDLLATLAESGEGVSLVTILTKAVLENRAARAQADGSSEERAAVPVGSAPPPDTGDADAPSGSGADDGDPFMRGAPATASDGGSVAVTVVGPPGDTEPVADENAGDGGEHGEDSDGEDVPPDPETEERYDAQMGARVARTETFYPSLPAFVECFLAHVFPFHQSASSHIQWVPDWWRHPALVFPLDAIWRSYETARRSPGQMMIWYIQASSMLDRVFDKDRGIVASIDAGTITTAKGDPLPCERPSRGWRAPIVGMLSAPRPGCAKDSVDIEDHGDKED